MGAEDQRNAPPAKRERARYIHGGYHILVDGHPISNLPDGARVVIDTARPRPTDVIAIAEQNAALEDRRQNALQVLAQFVAEHAETLVRRVRRASQGDTGLTDDLALEDRLAKLNPGGTFGDELRTLGLLDGTRAELAEELENRRRGYRGDRRFRPSDLLGSRVIKALGDVFRAPEVAGNLGGDTPEGLAQAIGDELLQQDATAVPIYPDYQE